MFTEKLERDIDLRWALSVILMTLIAVILLGSSIGYKYFWNQYDTTSRLVRELTILEENIKEHPEDLELKLQLGWVYYQQQEFEKAADQFRKVLKLNPNHVGGLFNLGLVYLENRKYSAAEKNFQAILLQYPDHLEVLLALSELYVKTKKSDQAIETLGRLHRINYSWTQSHYLMGQAYLEKGMKEEAEKSFSTALSLDPTFAPAKEGLKKAGGLNDAN